MTTYNRAELETYQLWILQTQKKASKHAVSLVKKWLKSHPTWEAVELREACIGIVQATVGEYGEYAASIACDLYDACMSGAGYKRAEVWTGNAERQIENAVKYQLSKALDGDTDGFVESVDEMTHNYVRHFVNETTRQNVERDRTYTVRNAFGDMNMPTQYKPKARRSGSRGNALEIGDIAYARVPTGARTCTYCMMQASRGFVFHSKATAEAGDHRQCDCLIVPGRHGIDTIEGIDKAAQYEAWRDLESLEAYAAQNPDKFTPKELEQRKQEIFDRYDGLTLSDEPGEIRKHVANSGGPSAWYTARERMGRYYDAEANARA